MSYNFHRGPKKMQKSGFPTRYLVHQKGHQESKNFLEFQGFHLEVQFQLWVDV